MRATVSMSFVVWVREVKRGAGCSSSAYAAPGYPRRTRERNKSAELQRANAIAELLPLIFRTVCVMAFRLHVASSIVKGLPGEGNAALNLFPHSERKKVHSS